MERQIMQVMKWKKQQAERENEDGEREKQREKMKTERGMGDKIVKIYDG